MSRPAAPYVSRSTLAARGQLEPPPPQVITVHAATADDEIRFSDDASPPAGTRLDADRRHAQAADGSDGGSGNTGIAAPPTNTGDEAPRTWCEKFADFFHYETVQVVRIRNKKASVIFRVAQLLILAYIIGYGLIWKKGYQATAEGHGTASSKLKGVAYSNSTQPWLGPNATASFQIYDSYDLVSPVLEDDCLFVTTNMWVTLGQTRGQCVSFDKTNVCSNTTDGPNPMCQTMGMVPAGRQLGPDHCLFNSTDPKQLWPTPKGGFCKLFAWCPAELERTGDLNTFRLQGVENFTVFTRLTVRFPSFGPSAVLDNSDGLDQLTPGLNMWSLEEMVRLAGYKWHEVNTTGILIALDSNWDCDWDTEGSRCMPTIKFTRLDDPHSALSKGFNFRDVEYVHDASGSRTLTKRYGVRLLILMSGTGSRFDPVALFTAIGAGIGLLAIASLVADMIATKLLRERTQYVSAKFKEVTIKDPLHRGLFHTLSHLTHGHSHAAGTHSSSEEEDDIDDDDNNVDTQQG